MIRYILLLGVLWLYLMRQMAQRGRAQNDMEAGEPLILAKTFGYHNPVLYLI